MAKVAKALIYDSAGKVLLLTRGETHPFFAGEVDLPGGIIEDNETYETGIIREVYEEAGLSIHPDQLVLSFSYHSNSGRERRLYSAYLDTESPQVTISWEHSAYRWAPVQELVALHEQPIKDSYIQRVVAFLRSTQAQ